MPPRPAKSATKSAWTLALVTLGVFGLISICRALGFGDGPILGATPASGVALAAALVFRTRGAIAAAAGFALAGVAWGLAPGVVLTDTAAHGLAALGAAHVMRLLARRYRPQSKTHEWLVFLAGVAVFTALVAVTLATGVATGLVGGPPNPRVAPFLAVVFEPLGLMTTCAALFSLREIRAVRADPRPALSIVALACALLLILSQLLGRTFVYVSPSGVTLLVSLPFCLWVAMQRRSLDGAALSFLAAHAVLLLVLDRFGAVTSGSYVATILYLNFLVATCQLVHAVNRDRLAALDENQAHRLDLEKRVAERTARLRTMGERALAADAAKSKLLATVSHEVRTPLNGVIGMASVVLAGKLDPRTRQNVEVIRTSGLHLLDVINRILDYSKLGHETEPSRHVAFDLGDLVAEVLDEARVSPQAEGLSLVADIDPEMPLRRFGYRQGLRQVLTNLVGNAAKFTERGSVTVRLRPLADDRVRIEVRDTGVGIPPELQERIFRPFEQIDGALTRSHAGTGLGLSISAEIVERMGGRIGVASAVDQGAVFWAELPLARFSLATLAQRAPHLATG